MACNTDACTANTKARKLDGFLFERIIPWADSMEKIEEHHFYEIDIKGDEKDGMRRWHMYDVVTNKISGNKYILLVNTEEVLKTVVTTCTRWAPVN